LIYRHDIEEEPAPPQPSRASFLATVGLRQVAFFQSPRVGTQAFLVESDRSPRFAALVFRGTEQQFNDVLADLETYPKRVSAPDVRVHDGFEEALDAVWSSVSHELANLECPVFYAGHSLGAALSTLAASRRPPRAVYTFGSPRVGNEAFAATLGSVALHRVVDDIDVVTTLPPEELGFTRVGEFHQIGTLQRGRVSLNPWHWVRRLMAPPRSLADHAPINYVRRIS
jgi:pimeloyl-ACP methyl ester carboxylesterase